MHVKVSYGLSKGYVVIVVLVFLVLYVIFRYFFSLVSVVTLNFMHVHLTLCPCLVCGDRCTSRQDRVS